MSPVLRLGADGATDLPDPVRDGSAARGWSLVLDRVAWAVLCERWSAASGGSSGVPAAFVLEPELLADPAELEAARQEAQVRLRAAGLLDSEGAVLRLSARAARFGAVLAGGGVRVQVRAWSGDRAVLADLVVADTGGSGASGSWRGPGLVGVGLLRLERVDGRGAAASAASPRGDGVPGVGVELSAFDGARLVDGVWRVVPPSVRRAVPALAPGEDVTVPWPTGGHGVPEVLADLANGPDAAVSVVVMAVPGNGEADGGGGGARQAPGTRPVVWQGTWLVSAGRMAAVRPGDPVEAAPGQESVRFVGTSGSALRHDLLGAAAQAVEVLTDGVAARDGRPGSGEV